MADKIYEYRDEQDWFIATWADVNNIVHLGKHTDDEFGNLKQGLQILNSHLNNAAAGQYQAVIVKKTSDFKFISFIADMINQEMNHHLKVQQHAGAVLVSEDEQLFWVHIPQKGIAMADFFGQSTDISIGDVLLVATRNEGKTREFRKLFEKLGIKVANLNDFPDLPEVKETGMTFEENARLKAETISDLTGKMVLADDSGLKVDVLGGLPGVWSARFAGPDATDADNNRKLLHELAMVFERDKRSAQFHTTLVVAAPGRDSLVVEADWDGYIATEPKGDNGFGYDPLFLVGETGKTSAQLSPEEKNNLSHRGKAVKKLMEVFPSWQNAK